MSKIDEAYIKYVLNQGDDNPDYAIVFKILDELKPYVELAEIVIKNSKNLDRNSRFLKELGSYESDRLFELLQTIYNSSKEQSE